MNNLVGNNIPSATVVAKYVAELQAMLAGLETATCNLSAEQRRRAVKPRIGAEKISNLVATLADAQGLYVGQGMTVDDLRNDLLLVERLTPLVRAAQLLANRLSDTLLEAQSEAWWATTAYYGALGRAAKIDPALERELQPVIEFFAKKKRGGKGGNGGDAPAGDSTPPTSGPTPSNGSPPGNGSTPPTHGK